MVHNVAPLLSFQETLVVTEKVFSSQCLLFAVFILRTLDWQLAMCVHQSSEMELLLVLTLKSEKTLSVNMYSVTWKVKWFYKGTEGITSRVTSRRIWTLYAWSILLSPNKKIAVLPAILPRFQRRRWHPTPVLLPGKSHGRRSLVGCSPWGR